MAFITLVHIGLLCVYLLKYYRKRNTISEEELSPFNVDDDEPMLDASAPYNPEQTSFPPYNVGGPNYPNGNEPMMSYNTPGEDFWNSSWRKSADIKEANFVKYMYIFKHVAILSVL